MQATTRAARFAGCLIVLTTACRKHPEAPVADPAAGVSHSQGAPAPAPLSPLSQKELPTTAATIAMGNLEGSLLDMERRLSGSRPPPMAAVALARLYLAHGAIVGKLMEYDRAEKLVAGAAHDAPGDRDVLVARAEIHGTFHRFPQALADLAAAEKLGASGRELDSRAGTLMAMGRRDEARPLLEKKAQEQPTISSLGMLASLLADEGRTAEAEKLYVEAQHKYRDVSPFPVAWLWLQQGMMWQRAGRPARARELLEGAIDRLPMYAPALSHLAAVEAVTGDRDKAIARLRTLVAASDDPEYKGQLAELLRAAGEQAEADKLHAEAVTAYGALLAAHPEAFADHAARTYLAWGDRPAEALRLAEQNLAARATSEAAQLVVEAAIAANQSDRACTAADLALRLAPRSAPMHNLAWKAYTACGRKQDAAAALDKSVAISHESPQ